MQWDSITLEQYFIIKELLPNQNYKELLQRVLNKSYNDTLAAVVFTHEFAFIQNPPEAAFVDNLPMLSTFDGFEIDPNNLTLAQFTDYCNVIRREDLSMDDKMTCCLALVLTKKDQHYLEGYSFEEAITAAKKLPFLQALKIYNALIDNVKRTMQSFPLIFGDPDFEGAAPEGPAGGASLEAYGILPFIMEVCHITNETYTNLMRWPVSQVLYLASYAVTKNKIKEQQIKAWKSRIHR